MNPLIRSSLRILVVTLLTLSLPFTHDLRAQSPSSEGDATKISIPWRNKDGVLVAQITGDRVRMRSDKKAEIENLVAQAFQGTRVEWTLSTPFCIMDQQTREAVSDASIQIDSREVLVTGTGFHWLANEGRLIVRSNVKVSIAHGITKR